MNLTKPITTLFCTILLILAGTFAHAQIQTPKLPFKTPIKAYELTDGANREAGLNGNLLLTISMDIEPDWYTYSHKPGEMGKPTRLIATAADKTQLPVFYPAGKQKPDTYDPSIKVNAYLDGTRLFVLIPTGLSETFPIAMRLDMLLCHPTKCLPVRMDLTFDVNGFDPKEIPLAEKQPWWPDFIKLAKTKTSPPQAIDPLRFEKSDRGLIKWNFTPRYLQPGLEVAGLVSAMLMGLLAGLILNIMPCVLPVVSLKLSALLSASGSSRKKDREHAFREHNIFFALGIITFFLVLALVLGGTGLAWGALFQNQWLVLGLAGIIMALALSLFGLFHLPIVDLKFASGNSDPRKQAFFTGVLTTLLATPCSGPFLGGVLGWALVQGPVVIATVFTSIGFGMAIPYLLMALNPTFARYLPKSGPWIVYVEKSIAFFLIGTAFYLMSISFGSESIRILAPLWALLFGGWLLIQTRKTKNIMTRWAIRFSVFAILAASIFWTMPDQIHGRTWDEFNSTELSQRIGKEKIFLDFTADWCPTCKVLEATVLTNENIIRWRNMYGIAFIKVDMTKPNPEAEALLRSLGSRSIPTAALFSTGKESNSPLVLRDIYTESQLENILKSWKK